MSTARAIGIEHAVRYLRSGGLLIYPTETAYALGCDATNPRAVRAIFRLKGRERDKPLPLIAASVAMAKRYARFTPFARRLVKEHWPGPLTMVLDVAEAFRPSRGSIASPPLPEESSPSHRGGARGGGTRSVQWEREGVGTESTRGRDQLAPGILAPNGTIALRVSSHPIARALSRRLGRPIVSTSANRSGSPPCYAVPSALRSLNIFLPGIFIFDTGPLPHCRPSTIVDARGERPVVLRHGSIRL